MRNPKPEILDLIHKHLQPWVDRMKSCIHVLRPDLTKAEIILLGSTIMSQLAGQSLLEGVSMAIWGTHELTGFQSAEILTNFCLQGLGMSLPAE